LFCTLGLALVILAMEQMHKLSKLSGKDFMLTVKSPAIQNLFKMVWDDQQDYHLIRLMSIQFTILVRKQPSYNVILTKEC